MKFIYILFFTFFSFVLFAQPAVETQIFSENVGEPGDTSINVFIYDGYQNEGSLTFIGTAFVESNDPSTGYSNNSGEGNIFFNYGQSLRISGISTLNYAAASLEVSFGIYKSSDDSDGTELTLEYSSNGINFNSLSFEELPTGIGTAGWYFMTVAIPPIPPVHNLPNLTLRITNTTVEADPVQFRIDDISMKGDYFIPVISPSDTSFSLPPVVVGEFDSIEYIVSAIYLIQNVEIISENPSFEIYDSINDLWVDTLTLSKDGQVLEDQPVNVLIRHSPIDAVGDEIGIFRHKTFGGPDTIVRVYGTAIATEPEVVTSTFSAIAHEDGYIALSWTGGDGDRKLVIAKENLPVNFIPTDGIPPQQAEQDFTIAPAIDGNKFVYDGDGDNTIIYGLNPSTTYHFTIYEYNVGTWNSHNYLTIEALTVNRKTVDGPPGLQIEEASTAYLINFQETVPNVLNGPYNGMGMSPSGLPGLLNTSSWRISLRSTATSIYYGPNPGIQFGIGPNSGNTNTGGIYAFQTGGGNIALGVKPFQTIPSNSIFSSSPGGFFELKSQNKTNQTIEEAYVSFVYYVYNNGNYSTSLKFSYSLNGTLFNPVSGLDFETPTVADSTLTWKKYVYSVKIPGISIPPDGHLYIRWTGVDGSGSGSRDAVAIDDITIAMDPDENFEGGVFSGIVHSGKLAANIRLNGSSSIVDSIILQDSAILSTGIHNLTLGDNVSIDETDGYIKGNLLVSRVIVPNVAQTFGGIGLSITTPVAAGLTNVKRVTGVFEGSGDNLSIGRWFEIVPTNNVNLNATMAFTFRDFESPNFIPSQDNFRLFRRAIGSYDPWVAMAPGTLTGTTYTVNGIATFNAEITGGDINNAPLPLDWLSFEVNHEKGLNLLKWVTANEVNTSSFEIEKSYDGKAFTSVGIIPAKGGFLSQSYQYTDKHDRPGLIYYRIKQIDRDQKYSYSALRAVNASPYQKMSLYPTSVLDQAIIFSEKEMEVQIHIVNAGGAIVKQVDMQLSAGEQPLSLQNLVPGVYWIQIENHEIKESFRIVKH